MGYYDRILDSLKKDNKALKAALEDLRQTVLVSCNPPDDCNDPAVLKKYMAACYQQALRELERKNNG